MRLPQSPKSKNFRDLTWLPQLERAWRADLRAEQTDGGEKWAPVGPEPNVSTPIRTGSQAITEDFMKFSIEEQKMLKGGAKLQDILFRRQWSNQSRMIEKGYYDETHGYHKE